MYYLKNKLNSNVIIDPATDIYYSSFYIKGLIKLYGKNNIIFDSSPFSEIGVRIGTFNFLISNKLGEKKYSISINDSAEINESCYNWCDVYGSVNTNWDQTPDKYKGKLVTLAPSFGIRLWDLESTIYYMITNYLKCENFKNFKKHVGQYKRQYFLRMPIEEYKITSPEEDYIFHASTLWQSDEWVKNDEFVNRFRALFIEACKSIDGIRFEGGFYHTKKHPLNQSYKHLVIDHYIPNNEYINKISKSTLVFNTPAWQNCNGWKLGEFLALGKAIISTPLVNDLPIPLSHGVNVHFVSPDFYEIREAIKYICKNRYYREKISKGAYEYYSKYGSPITSLGLLGITK